MTAALCVTAKLASRCPLCANRVTLCCGKKYHAISASPYSITSSAIIATAIPAAMRPYSMRMPLEAAVRAIQHCAVETDERGGCNRLLYLIIGGTSSFCQFSVTLNAICTRNLCCHSEANEVLGFPVQSSVGFITASCSSQCGFSA